jgi:hypothetical protein
MARYSHSSSPLPLSFSAPANAHLHTLARAFVRAQLGFTSGTTQTNLAATSFGIGSIFQPIARDDVQCDGTETSILQCSARMTNDCTHSEDIGVICSTNTLPPAGGPPVTAAPVTPPSGTTAAPVFAPTFAPVRPGSPTSAPTFPFQNMTYPPTVPMGTSAPTDKVTPLSPTAPITPQVRFVSCQILCVHPLPRPSPV